MKKISGIAVAGVGFAGWCAPALAPHIPPIAKAAGIPCRLEDESGVLLTFDDGPHPEGTPAVLEVLREHSATATFFVIGEQVRKTGSLLEEIISEGHAIAFHGDRHRNLVRVPPRSLVYDLDSADETIGQIALPVHRPPGGNYSAFGLREVRRRSWTPLLWSRWGRDWSRFATPESITKGLTNEVTPGDVLLLHDADDYSSEGSFKNTVKALPRVLEKLEEKSLKTLRLNEVNLTDRLTASAG